MGGVEAELKSEVSVSTRPDAAATGAEDTVRVQLVLHLLVELHLMREGAEVESAGMMTSGAERWSA